MVWKWLLWSRLHLHSHAGSFFALIVVVYFCFNFPAFHSWPRFLVLFSLLFQSGRLHAYSTCEYEGGEEHEQECRGGFNVY